MFEIILLCILGISVISNIVFLQKQKQPVAQSLTIDMTALQRTMDSIPNKVLQSINGSINNAKGPLGELVGYLQIRASYDRIIPLGDITDFVGIKFSETDSQGNELAGHIDFIDIKTGDKSRLSKDQRNLQKLIQDKKINFIKLKIDDISSEDISKST